MSCPSSSTCLRGEMSLVGPRPCIPYEYELYQPWQRRRFDAVPGLTGLWQVSGKNRTTFNEMIRLDIEYSERMSLWLDLKIILKTLPALWQQCLDSRAQKRRQAARASGGHRQNLLSYIAYENNEGNNQGRGGGVRLLGAEPDPQFAAVPGLPAQAPLRRERAAAGSHAAAVSRGGDHAPVRGPAERRGPGRGGHRHAGAIPLRDGQGLL